MSRLAIIVGAVLAFLLGGVAYGQSCRPGFVHSPVHVHRPSYYQAPKPVTIIKEVVKEIPIAFPVLVPAYQFQYSPPCFAPSVGVAPGVAPGYGAGHAPVYQPNQTPGYAGPGYNAGPGAPPPQGGNLYGGPSPQDKIKDLAKALLEEMRRQSEQEQNGDGPPVVVDPNAPPAPPLPPGGNQPPLGGNIPPSAPPGGMTKEQAQPLALNALSRACAQCHTGQGSKAEVVIFSQPDVFNPGAPLKSMRREIDAGRMPPSSYHYRLTPEELQALRIWLPAVKE